MGDWPGVSARAHLTTNQDGIDESGSRSAACRERGSDGPERGTRRASPPSRQPNRGSCCETRAARTECTSPEVALTTRCCRTCARTGRGKQGRNRRRQGESEPRPGRPTPEPRAERGAPCASSSVPQARSTSPNPRESPTTAHRGPPRYEPPSAPGTRTEASCLAKHHTGARRQARVGPPHREARDDACASTRCSDATP